MALNNTHLIHQDPSVVLKMGHIAAKLAFYNFQWRYITLVIFNNIKVTGLATFLKNYNQSVLLKMGRYIPRQRAAIQLFVLFAQESSELAGMLEWLANNQYDISGKFIIICSTIDSVKCNQKEIFETLSRVFIVNVLLIKGFIDDKEPSLFSYFLVLPEKCNNSEPVKINISLGCSNDNCFKSAFPEIFSNMYQCPFVVSTVEQLPFMHLINDSYPVGGDGELLRLVVNILNASLVLTTPKDGNWGNYENNKWTGSLGDVFNDHAHASMCSSPLTPAKYGNFQISFTYNSMDIVWASGYPSLKPPWAKLVYPLQMSLRIILLFMFIGIIFINMFTKTRAWRKIIKALKIDPPKSNLLFYSWIIFLGMPIIKMPSKPSLLLIVGMWLWCTFLIRTVYQAALITVMKQRYYEDAYQSFNDVLASHNPFGGLVTLREYYSEDKYVYDNWNIKSPTDIYSTLDDMSNGTSNFVLALNKETILYKLLKHNGSRRLQIIPEKIVNSPTVMFFKRYSFFTAPVSRILSASMEGGFGQRSHLSLFSKGKSLLRHSRMQRTVTLQFEHFVGNFVILIAGWLISILFFVVEVMCGKIIQGSMHPFNN